MLLPIRARKRTIEWTFSYCTSTSYPTSINYKIKLILCKHRAFQNVSKNQALTLWCTSIVYSIILAFEVGMFSSKICCKYSIPSKISLQMKSSRGSLMSVEAVRKKTLWSNISTFVRIHRQIKKNIYWKENISESLSTLLEDYAQQQSYQDVFKLVFSNNCSSMITSHRKTTNSNLTNV